MHPGNAFQIQSANKSFADKQKSVFDQLDVAEKNAKNLLSTKGNDDAMDTDSRRSAVDLRRTIGKRQQRSETRHLRGRESIFKRPEAPLSKCLPHGRVPDFRKNPQKWTKYTLEDVKDEDMSDRGNTAAAMSFLREIEDRKAKPDINDDSPKKITFNKSALVKDDDTQGEEGKSTFRSSKVVMQEYVVGQKVKKDRKNREKRGGSSKQLKLDHLLDEEEGADF